MGCNNAVLTEPLLENQTINCLIFEEYKRQQYNDNLCLFRALALHLHGNQRLKEKTLNFFKLFIKKMDGVSADQFQGVHINGIHFVEDLLTLNILLFVIDIVDGNIIIELVRRSVQKYENTVRLLRYNNHICYVSNINAVVRSFRCPNCDTFFSRTFSLEPHITTCNERVKNIYPRNVYQIREALWQAGLFRYQVHEWTRTLQKFSKIRLWINLCPRGILERHKQNNLDRETCPDICIHFFKPCGRINFPLQLWSSSPRCILFWSS